MNYPGLSIFFPAYNEQENIERTVTDALSSISKLISDYEIIIIDDGSRDRTPEIADTLARSNPQIRVVHHPCNQGYGAAIKSGFAAASKELVFFADGDGQFDLAEISLLLTYISKADLVIGYRIKRRDPWHRLLFGKMWGLLVGVLFNLWVKDIDCAFKLFKISAIKAILPLKSDGAVISTELLVKAKQKGLKIKQVGVHHYPRQAGSPTGAKLSVIIKAFRELFKLRRDLG